MSKMQSFFKFIGLSIETSEKATSLTDVDTNNRKSTIRRTSVELKVGMIPDRKMLYRHYQDSFCKKQYDPKKKDLIFDLDNTLICAFVSPPPKKHLTIKVKKIDSSQKYYVVLRPGLYRALKKLARSYNIFVFTAGASLYARYIIHGTGLHEYLCKIYDRDSCIRTKEGKIIKNIWEFEFRKDKTIFVDDSYLHVNNHPENGLLIKPFHGETFDRELLKVADFLDTISELEDVRTLSNHYDDYIYQTKLTYEREMSLLLEEDAMIEQNCSDTVELENSLTNKYQDCREIQSL